MYSNDHRCRRRGRGSDHAGYSGFHIAFYFNRTSTAGPGGVRVFEPRNSPFVVLCGSFLGMLCVWIAKMLGVLSTTDFKIAVVVALIAGAAAGIYGRIEGSKARAEKSS